MNWGELEGRLDVFFYNYEFRVLKKKLAKSSNTLMPLGNLVCELYRYPTFYDIDYKKEGVRVLKIVNISKEGILLDHNSEKYDFIEPEISQKFPRTILSENDLVMAVRGATIGKVALVTEKFSGANINANLIRISPKQNLINSFYLWIYLNTHTGKKLFSQQVANTAKQTITVPQIRALKIPVHPIEKQKEIVNFFNSKYNSKKQKEANAQALLNSIDDYLLSELGIELPSESENNLKERAFITSSKTLFGNRFDTQFHHTKYQILVNKVKKFSHTTLSKLAQFSSDTWNQKDRFKNEFPYIEISAINILTSEIQNIEWIPITKAPSRAKMLVKSGDILLSTTRPNRGAITLLDETKHNYIASTGFAVLRNFDKNIAPKYLLNILRSKLCLKQFEQRSSGGNYPAITTEELKKILIPLPPIEKQQAIAEKITAIRAEAKRLQIEAETELQEAKAKVEKMILGI